MGRNSHKSKSTAGWNKSNAQSRQTMSEKEDNTQGRKLEDSKLRIISIVLSIICLGSGSIFGIRYWSRLDIESMDPDALWNDAKWAIVSALIGCGFYILGTLSSNKLTKGRKYTIVGFYVLLLILIAVFFRFLLVFINNWF